MTAGALRERHMNVDTHNRNVVDFYDVMFNKNRPAEAIERDAGAEYRQHNPHVGDGKQAFIDYFGPTATITVELHVCSGSEPPRRSRPCARTTVRLL